MMTVTPLKPWRPSATDRSIQLIILLVSAIAAYAVVRYTGFSGRLPEVIFFGVFSIVGLASIAGVRRGKEAAKDAVMAGLAYSGIFALLLPVVSIMWAVISRGTAAI